MSYMSPISVDFITEMVEKVQKEEELAIISRVKAVIDVDKEELVKALTYDRQQYEKGYQDGYIEALEKVKKKAEECGWKFYYIDELLEWQGGLMMRGETE